jgi:signal transduction histidine kinase
VNAEPLQSARSARPRVRPLAVFVGGGLVLGAAYAVLNTLFDVLARDASLPVALVAVHAVVDRVIPLFAGALLGVAGHYVRLRSELARAEARRADELHARLKKVERDQAVWVVVASTLHEVKNPLHSLGLLLDELAIDGASERAQADALLARAGAQMDRIKASLAALRALAEDARPALGTVSLDGLVGELARDISPLASKSGIALAVHAAEPVRAVGDASFIRIILENLVSNSLDVLRERGGAGRLDIDVVHDGGDAIVRVKDDGPGLDPDCSESLFEPLATTKARGLGLGLSIARALARAMHGEVAYERLSGWSATFLLRLPEGRASESAP